MLSMFCCCLPTSPHLTLNNNRYTIIRLLGEGGFSYVYLVRDHNKQLYALKKTSCPYGSSDTSYKNAIKEIQTFHRFASKSPYIVSSVDEAVVSEPDGSKTVYIVMPYFEKSLHDTLNMLVLNNERMEEAEIVRILIGICRGLKAMHGYRKKRQDRTEEDDTLLASDDESEGLSTELDELVPYAHRDLKPANIMLSADGSPVLVDLGSCTKARVRVRNKQHALALADYAQEHCTLPYRAPELLEVKVGSKITEKSDIWSLGCLLYALCFGFSPFEKLEIERGANLSLAIAQGRYDVPENGYSEGLVGIIERCIRLEPDERPSIGEVIEMVLAI